MSRKKLIAANWKMYKTPDEAVAFIKAFLPLAAPHSHAEVVLCASPTLLPAVTVLADSYNRLAADKDVRVADKEKKKDDLEAYDKAVLPKYQNAINVSLTA